MLSITVATATAQLESMIVDFNKQKPPARFDITSESARLSLDKWRITTRDLDEVEAIFVSARNGTEDALYDSITTRDLDDDEAIFVSTPNGNEEALYDLLKFCHRENSNSWNNTDGCFRDYVQPEIVKNISLCSPDGSFDTMSKAGEFLHIWGDESDPLTKRHRQEMSDDGSIPRWEAVHSANPGLDLNGHASGLARQRLSAILTLYGLRENTLDKQNAVDLHLTGMQALNTAFQSEITGIEDEEQEEDDDCEALSALQQRQVRVAKAIENLESHDPGTLVSRARTAVNDHDLTSLIVFGAFDGKSSVSNRYGKTFSTTPDEGWSQWCSDFAADHILRNQENAQPSTASGLVYKLAGQLREKAIGTSQTAMSGNSYEPKSCSEMDSALCATIGDTYDYTVQERTRALCRLVFEDTKMVDTALKLYTAKE